MSSNDGERYWFLLNDVAMVEGDTDAATGW